MCVNVRIVRTEALLRKKLMRLTTVTMTVKKIFHNKALCLDINLLLILDIYFTANNLLLIMPHASVSLTKFTEYC